MNKIKDLDANKTINQFICWFKSILLIVDLSSKSSFVWWKHFLIIDYIKKEEKLKNDILYIKVCSKSKLMEKSE
jgi:hypothetical protein